MNLRTINLTLCLIATGIIGASVLKLAVGGEADFGHSEIGLAMTGNISSLPEYNFPIEDGLYATLTAFSSLETEVGKDRKDTQLDLKKVKGFKKSFKVQVLWQKKKAPVVVLLLGLATKANSPLAQIWKTQMYEVGCHVVTFDSPFLPGFSDRSRHGVAGNIEEEARLVGQVIESFLEHKKSKKLVSKVGLVGGSYGGLLALHVARMAEKKEVNIPIKNVLVFSPPVNMETAAKLLDKYHREDRWKYTLAELGLDMAGHKAVAKGEKIPFSKSEMRAGIAAAFRMDLEEVVDNNDRLYNMGLLPVSEDEEEDDQYRKDVAETWTFTKFVNVMAFKYWSEKGKASSPEELWAAGRLEDLIQDSEDNVQVVLTRDDPLNDPDELISLESSAPAGMLTVLPRGGHLGYLGTDWAKAKLQSLFK